jgi:hypothetical protein
MRDLVVREALKTMARDAAKRLREIVAAGHQIPYDVEESGGGTALPQYIPLTARFIRDQASALLELDSFGSGCAAIESAGLAGPYLEEIGISVPADHRKRAELAGIVFLCRLWDGSTDFSLDPDRLTAAIGELEAGGEVTDDEIEVVVPIRGLQLPVTRLELATATIVRADTVEVPAEARASEGSGSAGWEPTFLAAARVSAGPPSEEEAEPKPDVGARAVDSFRRLITTLRLFKVGSVSLGPYAWTRAGANRWRRIATGAGRSRPGRYLLAEHELGDLTAFSRALAYRSGPLAWATGDGGNGSPILARAVSRFEAGLERGIALEALNDYLLALRFLLEGDGPAGLGLSIRVAALCAEPEGRPHTKAIIDRGIAMERELWSGDPAVARDALPTPAETTAEIEDLVRAILGDAACGHLGSDLRSTADEILLADGFAVGEGGAEQRGGDEEWEPIPQVEEDPEEARPATHPPVLGQDELRQDVPVEPASEPARVAESSQDELWIDAPGERDEPANSDEPASGLQVPELAGRIRVESRTRPEEQNVFSHAQTHPDEPPTMSMDLLERSQDRVEELLAEQQPESAETAETAARVAYLFPRPETTEWDVRELSYDRRRRARVRAS